MGTWGTGISSNDVYEDIYYKFFELYNQGIEVTSITEKLIKENKEGSREANISERIRSEMFEHNGI
jgi:hypothetical protein